MAHAIDLNPHTSRHGQRGPFSRLARSVADYRAYRAIRNELDALTDRELADVGLSRLTVRDVARSAAFGG